MNESDTVLSNMTAVSPHVPVSASVRSQRLPCTVPMTKTWL